MDEPRDGSPPEAPRSSAPALSREDCWTDDATRTLVEAWGERYVGVNRGNLRQQHWQEVADAVNSRHGGGNPRSRRTDVQCKYRIDTLKKRYKTEKAKVLGRKGAYVSPWHFFPILDALIGPQLPAKTQNLSPPPAARTPFALPSIPVRPRSLREHAPYAGAADVFLRRKCTAPERADSGGSGSGSGSGSSGGKKERARGSRELVRAIKRLGEVYERVERKKQREMVEMEKQRMEFAKELEQHRMRLFVEMQVQLQKAETMRKKPRPS